MIAEQTSCTFVIEQDCEIQYSNNTAPGVVSRSNAQSKISANPMQLETGMAVA